MHNMVVHKVMEKGSAMAVKFRGVWLESFYEQGVGHRKIPAVLSSSLYRKVQILDAASQEFDLRIAPPDCRCRLKLGRWIHADGRQNDPECTLTLR
ncbi:type II toxin-antitoxin system RelE/ParE family toxin [Cobetia sp. 29-18-1]|uniref:type II toxin-antitoxin system RelE/ParE family toxin n=1 Tax=Cobetia sp. 29-18-1 TaxID=3040018 RepID=UPI002447E2B3|nr:type II toxin-antitoxin system RelE/ParE family toxin [Cobetia sp. 29-18-1]MDH2299785.1 type II toxin-antitoxin system RelE/ParE family toxin [Cobetia sp. 29-18-1]